MTYLMTYDGNIGGVPVPSGYYVGASIYAGYAITGTYSTRIYSNSSAEVYINFPYPNTSSPAVSMWLYLTGLAWTHSSYCKIQFLIGSLYVGLLWNGTNKTFDLYVNGSKVADGTVFLDSQSLFNLRIYGTIADSGGITVKINGETSIEYSGDTKPGSDTEVTMLYFWTKGALGASSGVYISSLSINDGGTDPGDRRAQVLMPDGDSSVQWTPSTGSDNYATVDEVPLSDTDYLETSTDGHKDLLTLEDFDGTDRTIAGVTKFVRAWKTTADAQTLYNGVNSGSTESYTEHELETAAIYFYHGMATNPDDSAAWEDADIDGLLAMHQAVIP